MLSYKFNTIDFETANNDNNSACAISVVCVRKNRIEKHVTHLIKPPTKKFTFTYIHGLSWDDVADSPYFNKVWIDIAKLFNDIHFIAAHNASFDRRVLYSCCKNESIIVPTIPFLCTVKLARDVWNIYPTNLPSVCRSLAIPLKHHDPASDALACAKIVIEAINYGVKLKKYYLF